jgi:hypothetical protein
MPLYALINGQPWRVLDSGPRRASCVDCGTPMRARTGSVRIWHWAHLAASPHCEAARETEWHLAWKILAIDGTQEVKVGRRRADVLAPGGFAVEFQASALDRDEVRAREDDWASQGGMAWVFKADKEFQAGRIRLQESLAGFDDHLVKPENRATLDITWAHAPERVRAARAPSFLDIGGGELLFIGDWPDRDDYPLEGYGWRVPKDWVVENLLRSSKIPAPFAGNPVAVRYKILQHLDREAEQQREAERKAERRRRESEEKQLGRGRWRAPFMAEAFGRLQNLLNAEQPNPQGSLEAVWVQELWPLRDDPGALRVIWAAAVKACGGRLPSLAAVRRARQEYEQEMRDQEQR